MAKRNNKISKLAPIVRVIAVLSAVGIITTIATFAALQSTGNALTGNTIETATPLLQISTNGSTFSNSVQGFDFKGIIPGGSAQPSANGGYLVALKNVGDSDLKLSVSIPTLPNVTGITDLSKVSLIINSTAANGTANPPQAIKLSALTAGQVAITNQGVVAESGTVTYHLQVSMDSDAVNGSSGTITNLQIAFSGTPQ